MTWEMFMVAREWIRLAQLAEVCDTPAIARWWISSTTVTA